MGSSARRAGWRALVMATLILGLSWTGCSDDSGPAGAQGDTTIGPAGGAVTGSGGAGVEIPPGALAVDTAISAAGVDAAGLPGEAQPYLGFLGGAEFGPEGTQFALPVTIHFPLDPPLAPGSAVSLLCWDPVASAWVDESFPVTLAADGASLSAEVTHFSLFGCVGDVFDSFHEAFGDGSTAEAAFGAYVSWFKANVTDVGRKGVYREDCHEVKGLRVGLSYDVMYYPDGPHYQGIPYVMEGESTDIQVTFHLDYERVQAGVEDFNYALEVFVFLDCCAPTLELSAEPASIGTGETSQVTARVVCDDEAMAGHTVDFESLGGLGTLSPASAAVNAAGQAVSTYTAGDDEGTESVRASITNCNGGETTDRATDIEIGGDWAIDLDIDWQQVIGEGPLETFYDGMSIHATLTIEEGVISGTGTGTHAVDTATGADCAQTALSAPPFQVVVAGAVTGEQLDFAVVAYSIPLSLTVTCYGGDEPDDFPYPGFGYVESALLAQYISMSMAREDGATDSGAGVDPEGEDIPMTWEWSCTLTRQ
ncbi:MAG: hypothetical protein R3C71_12925 [Candidatus Krumholzibacteriia bacterium]